VACLWISSSCVALAASAVRWRIEQADEFRQEVERYSDAERVILADAYQALVRYGPLPHPSSPLVIHRSGSRALGTPTLWCCCCCCCLRLSLAIRCSAMSSWCKRPTSSGALEGWFCQLGVGTETARAHTLCCVLSVGNLPPQPAQFLELSA
jgi:hypothetical protein